MRLHSVFFFSSTHRMERPSLNIRSEDTRSLQRLTTSYFLRQQVAVVFNQTLLKLQLLLSLSHHRQFHLYLSVTKRIARRSETHQIFPHFYDHLVASLMLKIRRRSRETSPSRESLKRSKSSRNTRTNLSVRCVSTCSSMTVMEATSGNVSVVFQCCSQGSGLLDNY